MTLVADESALAFWTAVTAMVAASGVLVTLIAAVVGWRLQSRAARRADQLDNIWRLTEYWDSERMWMMRARAALEIDKKKSGTASDMIEVLGFFEHIGYLLRRKWIDLESAWFMFSYWALPYWHAASYAIELDRRKDPTLWEEFAYLNRQLLKFETKKWRKAGRSYRGVTAQAIRDLVDGERRLWPGRPRWPPWWQR
jgi:hypothetical protein